MADSLKLDNGGILRITRRKTIVAPMGSLTLKTYVYNLKTRFYHHWLQSYHWKRDFP